ncbi:ribonuclease P [Candidatus Woesearchaeota archaeon]|nr:ribonuclease P [Candidatus Woesearchaeota archaeon]
MVPIQKKKQHDIALERIKDLFLEAEKRFKDKPYLSHRYVEMARKIAMKIKVQIPQELRRRFCRKCNHYLVPGMNCRIRSRRGKMVYTCLNCKQLKRIPHHPN